MKPKYVIEAYARRVASGAITIEDVHQSVRKEVEEKLREEEK